jgi:charged multivesicular body protein 7
MTELKKYLSTLPEFSTTSSRLSFLYSSLAPRKSANPTGFSSAIGWWRLLLLDLVAKGHLGEDKLILVADDTLREALRWDKIGRPSSLGTILVRC